MRSRPTSTVLFPSARSRRGRRACSEHMQFGVSTRHPLTISPYCSTPSTGASESQHFLRAVDVMPRLLRPLSSTSTGRSCSSARTRRSTGAPTDGRSVLSIVQTSAAPHAHRSAAGVSLLLSARSPSMRLIREVPCWAREVRSVPWPRGRPVREALRARAGPGHAPNALGRSCY